MTTGERIRSVRKAKNLTQKQLGDIAGIAEPTIRRYELGKLHPKFETVKKIAVALGVHWLDILGDDDTDHEELTDINDLKYAWDDWLRSNSIAFMTWYLKNGTQGLVILFLDTQESFFLTKEQAEKLPSMSIATVKSIIRDISDGNRIEPSEIPHYQETSPRPIADTPMVHWIIDQPPEFPEDGKK